MNLVYSPAIAQRLKKGTVRLHGKPTAVEVRKARVIVTFEDGHKEGVLRTLFVEQFVKLRQEQARVLSPEKITNTTWLVEGYGVNIATIPQCGCGDYAQQAEMGIKTPCCAHIYAVINQLGYTRLSDYLQTKPQLPKLPQWELRWETYATDKDGNPLEKSVNRMNRKPSGCEILDMRRTAHTKGFRLVAIERIK